MKDHQQHKPKLPENWSRKTIGDLCDFSNGNGFGPRDWSTNGLPIIRIQNLNGSQDFNYFSGEADQTWIVDPETILFAWAGTRGVSFGPKIWRGPRGVLNQHIYRIHPHNGVDPNWLYLALRHATDRIERLAHGFKSTLLHVSKSDITEQLIELPPLPEQRKIADILSTWDEALEKLDALIEAHERRKKALMQQLLTGRRRLKGFTDRWKASRFGEFLVESRIPGNDGSSANKLTVKLYGRGVVPKQERLAGSENTRYYQRKAGQFIYSKLDFLNGAFGIIPDGLDDYETTLDVPAFDVLPTADPKWLLHFVCRDEFYSQQLGAAAGGRKARRVNPSEFLAMKILAPSLEEQRQIAALLDTADQQLTLLRTQRSALDQQKRGLMQRLLTGQIRVRP